MRKDREYLQNISHDGQERIFAAHVHDLLYTCAERQIITATTFLDLRAAALARMVIQKNAAHNYAFSGGYEGAERQCLLFLPDYMEEDALEADDLPFCALRAQHASDQTLTHRDYLGALMAAGIKRENVGDILVYAGGADILLLRATVEYVRSNLDSVGRVKIVLSDLPLDALEVPETHVREIRDTVASLRLDNLVSAGFSLPRGEAQRLIAAGRVFVNSMECQKAEKTVAPGDMIAVRGFGKMRFSALGGMSRRGRQGVVLERYI